MTRFRAFAASVACAGLLLSGCNGDDSSDDSSLEELDPDATPRDSTPTPSEPEPTGELPDRPEDRGSIAGSKAFAKHVVDLINYSVDGVDAQPLLNVDTNDTCSSCRKLARSLIRERARGIREESDGILVRGSHVTTGSGSNMIVTLDVDFAAGRDVQDGRVIDSWKTQRNHVLQMGIVWHDGQWDLNDYTYPED